MSTHSEDLDAAADRLLSSPQARAVRCRLERGTFSEAEGRKMWSNVGKRRRVLTDPIGLKAFCPTADEVLSFVLWNGPQTDSARLKRLACVAWMMGLVDAETAARQAKCTTRTLRNFRRQLTGNPSK